MKNITITVCYAFLAIFAHAQIIPTLPAKKKAAPVVTQTKPVAQQPVAKAIADKMENNMVLVKGGTFKMGSNTSDSYDDEKPVHQVTISSFYISKYEVTQAQWLSVMGSNPSVNKCDNCPVENVSWDDAEAYCRKMSSQTGKTYRMPTEAE